ncbi:response regulator [Candidatus Woesearchaeota archaeon]|nr:response regulator [Candidatus Woesearchaeota archaeon]
MGDESSIEPSYRILAVTDNIVKAGAIRRELKMKGYGVDAFSFYADFNAEDYGLAVVDVLNYRKGIDLVEKLNESKNPIPIVALTGDKPSDNEIRDLMSRNICAYLQGSSLGSAGFLTNLVYRIRAKNPLSRGKKIELADLHNYLSLGNFLSLDDDKRIHESLKELFGDQKYNLICTDNEQSALANLRKYKTNVMLLDLVLNGPGNVRGIKIAERLGPNLPHTKLAMLTGHKDYADSDRLENFIDAYFTKPYRNDELIKEINILNHDRISKLQSNLNTRDPKFYIILAPNGTGKDTIGDGVASLLHDIGKIVTSTSRIPVEGEIQGIHHYFGLTGDISEYLIISEYRQDQRIGISNSEIERWRRFGMDSLCYYAPENPLREIQILKEKWGEMVVTIGLLPYTWEDLRKRVADRGKEEVNEEFIKSQWETYNSMRDEFDHFFTSGYTKDEWEIFNLIGSVIHFIESYRDIKK